MRIRRHSFTPSRREFLRTMFAALPAFAAFRAFAADEPTLEEPKDKLQFPVFGEDVEFLRRSSWTKTQPNRKRLTSAARYSRITIHHQGAFVIEDTEKSKVIEKIAGVYDTHIAQKYGDIGYHFIVDYAGRVWEGRSLSYYGAHVIGKNDENIAVMALGNFQEQRPSKKQVAAVSTVIDTLRSTYDLEKDDVFGHCDLGYTLCPGRHLYPSVIGVLRDKQTKDDIEPEKKAEG